MDIAADFISATNADHREAAQKERKKYEGIYTSPQYAFYGHCNNGAKALAILERWGCRSLLDVGCGFNEFVISARARFQGIKAIGADFACPGADIIACATRLPVPDKSFDVLTAFDVLEHLLSDQVDQALAEFARVSRRFIFSICHRASVITWRGQNLHPTVESEGWWMERISNAGGISLAKDGRFITGMWSAPRGTVPMTSGPMVIVGNGTSVLDRKQGAAIDDFADVVRFNAYKIDPYADFVGSKTTVWFNVIPFTNKRHPLIHESYSRVFLHSWQWDKAKCKLWQELAPLFHCPVSKVDRTTILELQEFAGDTEYFAYSTGMIALWIMIKERGFVTITGFDWWSREKHHYCDNGTRGNLHRPEKELVVLEKLRQQGKLAFLEERVEPE